LNGATVHLPAREKHSLAALPAIVVREELESERLLKVRDFGASETFYAITLGRLPQSAASGTARGAWRRGYQCDVIGGILEVVSRKVSAETCFSCFGCQLSANARPNLHGSFYGQ
jgi:hypothetical protein